MSARTNDPVAVQLVDVIDRGASGGLRVTLGGLALLAPGLLIALAAPWTVPAPTAFVTVVSAIVGSACAVVLLRDHFARAEPHADLREALIARGEARLHELASVPAMLLMAAAVGLVVVVSTLVGATGEGEGVGFLTLTGFLISALMLGNLAWSWLVEVPRLSAALERMRAG
jgi:hypothetical protein